MTLIVIQNSNINNILVILANKKSKRLQCYEDCIQDTI